MLIPSIKSPPSSSENHILLLVLLVYTVLVCSLNLLALIFCFSILKMPFFSLLHLSFSAFSTFLYLLISSLLMQQQHQMDRETTKALMMQQQPLQRRMFTVNVRSYTNVKSCIEIVWTGCYCIISTFVVSLSI